MASLRHAGDVFRPVFAARQRHRSEAIGCKTRCAPFAAREPGGAHSMAGPRPPPHVCIIDGWKRPCSRMTNVQSRRPVRERIGLESAAPLSRRALALRRLSRRRTCRCGDARHVDPCADQAQFACRRARRAGAAEPRICSRFSLHLQQRSSDVLNAFARAFLRPPARQKLSNELPGACRPVCSRDVTQQTSNVPRARRFACSSGAVRMSPSVQRRRPQIVRCAAFCCLGRCDFRSVPTFPDARLRASPKCRRRRHGGRIIVQRVVPSEGVTRKAS